MLSNGILKFMFGAIVAMFLATQGGRIEGILFPVVTGTELYRVEAVGDGYSRVWGRADLLRDCTDTGGFHHIEWNYGEEGSSVTVDVEFEEGTRIRDIGVFNFGPWLIQMTPSQVRNRSFAKVFHRCHGLWLTETRFYP